MRSLSRIDATNRMKRPASPIILAMLLTALLSGATQQAQASTTSGAVSVTGTVTNPATCSLNNLAINASYQIPYESYTLAYSKSATLTIKCSSGTTYSISPPAAQNLYDVGGKLWQLAITISSVNLYNKPKTGTGNGANQSIAVTLNFMKVDSGAFEATDTGTITGSIPINVSY